MSFIFSYHTKNITKTQTIEFKWKVMEYLFIFSLLYAIQSKHKPNVDNICLVYQITVKTRHP